MIQERDELSSKLIAEQLGHTLDLMRAEITSLQGELTHQAEMNTLRLSALEQQALDFEKRLRELTESATQFKLLVSLAVGGGLLSVIALMRSLLNP
jgi:chaperonin cofactor prefoldin